MRNLIVVVMLLLMGCTGEQGATGPAGPPGPGESHAVSGVLEAAAKEYGHWDIYCDWLPDVVVVQAWVRHNDASPWAPATFAWTDEYVRIFDTEALLTGEEYLVVGVSQL